MVELYPHSPICFYGVVLNYLSIGTTLPLSYDGYQNTIPDIPLNTRVISSVRLPTQGVTEAQRCFTHVTHSADSPYCLLK
jgi:hypothetical protein